MVRGTRLPKQTKCEEQKCRLCLAEQVFASLLLFPSAAPTSPLFALFSSTPLGLHRRLYTQDRRSRHSHRKRMRTRGMRRRRKERTAHAKARQRQKFSQTHKNKHNISLSIPPSLQQQICHCMVRIPSAQASQHRTHSASAWSDIIPSPSPFLNSITPPPTALSLLLPVCTPTCN